MDDGRDRRWEGGDLGVYKVLLQQRVSHVHNRILDNNRRLSLLEQ